MTATMTETDVPWLLLRGATVTDAGVEFSVWAPRAERVVVHVATGDAAGEHIVCQRVS